MGNRKDKINSKKINNTKKSNNHKVNTNDEKSQPNNSIDENKAKQEEITNSLEKTSNLERTDKIENQYNSDIDLNDSSLEIIEKNEYQLIEKIGVGSYGTVYKARHHTDNTEVAVKVMLTNRFSELFVSKFLVREIELMTTLPTHENVTAFYKIVDESKAIGLLFIVMELAPNGDLFDYMLRRRFLPEHQAIAWFKQLINGVEHIHKNGFAHRDLKCENLLLSQNFVIKITDFGFCCKLDKKSRVREMSPTLPCANNSVIERLIASADDNHNLTLSRSFCGSCVYASPELLRGLPYNPVMADIWSCGIILYTMLYGSYPKDEKDILNSKVTNVYTITLPQQPDISNQCKDLLNRIFVNENNRISVQKIKESEIFKKVWQENETNSINSSEYFHSLGITRQQTQPFEFDDQLSDSQIVSESTESLPFINDNNDYM